MNHNYEMYYDGNASSRSPTSQRQSSLHRENSRTQFESHGYLPSGLYTAEDHAAAARYDPGGRFGDGRNATIGGYGGGGGGYDIGGSSWNAAAFGNNNTLNGLGGGSGLRKPPSRGGRGGIPSAWLDQPQQMQLNQLNPYMTGLGGLGGHMRQDNMGSDPDDDLIPTAIVIKNIPFAIKKEQLVSIMTEMGLPLPYAFNYHFDNGVFRGLAFANFTNPDETATVIQHMNHFELNGRKLRVEYKKMLPAAERERIEREKRERRGQLEEQHRPMAPSTLQTQASAGSLSSRMMVNSSPSPVSARNLNKPGGSFTPSFGGDSPQAQLDVDLNDPHVLDFYSKLLLFKTDTSRDVLTFPPTLSPPERRIVHTLAHHMGMGHASKGDADRRAVHVFKDAGRARVSPPMPQVASLRGSDDRHRHLSRAATTDFSDVRGGDTYYSGGMRHQGSGYLGFDHPNTNSLGPAATNLRAARSVADLRSYTPSPVPSTASFPAALRNNLHDFPRDHSSSSTIGQSTTPTLMTPTSGLPTTNSGSEINLINGLGNMSLSANPSSTGGGFGGSPRGLRAGHSWDRDLPSAGTIGQQRSFSTNFEDPSRPRGGLERQPRGPVPERGVGFGNTGVGRVGGRTNGHATRGSDELSSRSSGAGEVLVE